MNNLDIALQLAAITGKPVEDFLNGTKTNRHALQGTGSSDSTDTIIQNTDEVEDSGSEKDSKFQSPFINGKVIGGRQMTRKEYLDETRDKTREEIVSSIYIHKMFRSEGQKEASFITWMNSFPRGEDEE